ncbi:MAG: PAS domain-containing sensor histidine kinase [Rhodospirillales bacterium]|nr:PAS domain-containing sensor histidine kinase [Rhodospirillales bacterium]
MPALVAAACLAVVVDLAVGSTPAKLVALACGLAAIAYCTWYRSVQRVRIADLLHSERRFRDFTEAGSHYVWEIGPDFRFTYVSDSIEKVTGDKPSDVIGKTRTEIRPDDPHTDASAAALQRQIEAGVPFVDVPIKRTLADGRVVHLMTAGKPYYDDRGRYLGYRCSSRDITAQVEAEQALKASEQRFRDFAELAADWLWERDAGDRLVWVSDSMERLVGVPASGIIGTQWTDLPGDSPERRTQIAAIRAKVAERAPFADLPFSRTDRDGQVLHLAISGKPFYGEDGTFLGYRGTTRDITDQVLAQRQLGASNKALQQTTEALAHSEHRFRDFANAASDWFWEQDEQHRFTFILLSDQLLANGRTGTSLGMTRRQANPHGASEAEWQRHEADLQARRPFRDFRFRRDDENGRPRFLSVNGVPLFDRDGRFTGYRGTGRDITVQVLAELEAQEARRGRDLAEAASRAKSQFLAHISHELRTPLNAIIGFSEVMDREMLGPIGTPKYREYAGDIQSSARHLLELINDMLDMARIEVGKYRIEPSPIAIAALMQQVHSMTRGMAEASGLALEFGKVCPDTTVFVDGRAVKQVLLNLISNSIKFTPSGGRITVDVREGDGGALQALVTDTGRGIPAAALPTLFEPFQQASPSQARQGGGSGLGLWISRNLMRMHGGDLSIASVEGEGTTATLTIPADRVLVSDVGAPKAVA